jgi:hypothetical protein
MQLDSDRIFILELEKYPILPSDSPFLRKPGCFSIVVEGYPIDVTIRQKKSQGGLPCVGHARRCQGTIDRPTKAKPDNIPSQCPKWASKRSIFCAQHGIRTSLVKTRLKALYAEETPDMASYKTGAGETLRKMLTQFEDEAPHEKLNLDGEIAVARMATQKMLNMYEKSVILAEDKLSVEARMFMSTQLRQHIEMVGELALKAVKIDTLSADVVDYRQLEFILNKMTEIINKRLKNVNPELALQIVEEMQDIQLPPRRVGGNETVNIAQEIRDAVKQMDDGTILLPDGSASKF